MGDWESGRKGERRRKTQDAGGMESRNGRMGEWEKGRKKTQDAGRKRHGKPEWENGGVGEGEKDDAGRKTQDARKKSFLLGSPPRRGRGWVKKGTRLTSSTKASAKVEDARKKPVHQKTSVP